MKWITNALRAAGAVLALVALCGLWLFVIFPGLLLVGGFILWLLLHLPIIPK